MGSHVIVGELTHDLEIVWNVKYESLWENLGMSDIIAAIIMYYYCEPLPLCLHYRDSFIKQFVETGNDMERLLKQSANRESSMSLALALAPATYACPASPLYTMSRRLPAFTTQAQGKLQKKTGVNCIVRSVQHVISHQASLVELQKISYIK